VSRPLIAVLALATLIAGGVFCYAGYLMASSFVISNPDRAEHWRRLGILYLALTAICAVAVVAICGLWYRRTRSGRARDVLGMRNGLR
jgi:ribose/xylose/arabinose/galactoside ABC-type transport system permease subunit